MNISIKLLLVLFGEAHFVPLFRSFSNLHLGSTLVNLCTSIEVHLVKTFDTKEGHFVQPKYC